MKHYEVLSHVSGRIEIEADSYALQNHWIVFSVLDGQDIEEEVHRLRADQVYSIRATPEWMATAEEPQEITATVSATPVIMDYFDYDHLSFGPMREASMKCYALARAVVDEIPDSAERAAGLRKLLEAKDCFVRASLALL